MLKIEVRVKGQIDHGWSDWLGELAISYTDDGNTVLSGPK
jgi:GTPase